MTRQGQINRRRGFTLIELIVALSLLATILPLAGGTVYLLLRAQTASADSLADAMTLSRFSRTFRADVHAAQSAHVNGEGSRLDEQAVFKLDPPRTISYSGNPAGAIVRTVRNGRSIERREEFRLAGTRTQFEMAADGRAVAAVHKPRALTVSGGPVVTATTSTIRIEAFVGRDRRFERPRAHGPAEPPAPTLPEKPRGKGKGS